MAKEKEVFELTLDGARELEKELSFLIDEARPKNVEAIKEARAQGDLSENADYDAAREEQARIEGRIKELEMILKNKKIIDVTKKNIANDEVGTGKFVTLDFVDFNKVETYKLVGTIEADPFDKKISNDSPIGRAIVGHKKGETVVFKSETGKDVKVVVLDCGVEEK